MGSISARDPGQRLLPDTPPDLVSPTATTYSARSSPATEVAWQQRFLVSPPMYSYDRSPAATMPGEKTAEAPSSRPDLSQAAPRQQLPSLSSLFGPPTSVRSLHSPMSERHGSLPTAATSPLDSARFAANERGQTDSYFPPTMSPPVPQPRSSYDSKADLDRSGLHPLRRSTSGPGSPRFRQLNHGRPGSRSEAEPGRWATQREAVKPEFSPEARDAAFRSSRDHFRLQFPGSRLPSSNGFSEHRAATSALNPPPTPSATIVTAEGLPSKDGLGPKIWTGTNFLPRFVRAAEVPGEGLCYFYDDGSHCKTVIDGEAVNAHWGVTKAGKPRKRLAIACITCREKKIKCDPDFPRCVQCEKFGRICKFKNAPRGGHNTSPSTPPPDFEELGKAGEASGASERDSHSPASPHVSLHQPSDAAGPNKRVKIDHDTYLANGEPSPAISRHLDHTKSPMAVMQRASPEMPRIPENVLIRAWQTDPYASDPQSINAVVSQFFAHIDSTMMLRFLPEQATKAWVAGSTDRKSPEDLMLLYSILAVGMALSGGPKHIAWEYAQVAHFAQKSTTAYCLQLAQCRILLAVYYISISRRNQANDMLSAAAATVASLRLNLELEKSGQTEMNSSYPLGLNKAGYCEARRRTLWSLFILERLSGMFPARLAMINAEDVFVRLPTDWRSFEEQVESHAPVFNPHELSLARMPEQPHDIAAYFVEIVHLWAESQSAVHKLANRPAPLESEAARVRSLVGAMEHWHSSLPTRLLATRSNLESAALAGNTGSFLTMHLLYNHAMIRLNRYSRAPRQLSSEMRSIHIQKCYDYTSRIVEMIEMLDRLLRARPMILTVPPPMVAAAIVEAVDILSANRPLSHVHEVIDHIRMMKPLVDTMGNVWEESRALRHLIEQRLRLLAQINERGPRQSSPIEGYRIVSRSEEKTDVYRWEIMEPMERVFEKDMDIVYFGLG